MAKINKKFANINLNTLKKKEETRVWDFSLPLLKIVVFYRKFTLKTPFLVTSSACFFVHWTRFASSPHSLLRRSWNTRPSHNIKITVGKRLPLFLWLRGWDLQGAILLRRNSDFIKIASPHDLRVIANAPACGNPKKLSGLRFPSIFSTTARVFARCFVY